MYLFCSPERVKHTNPSPPPSCGSVLISLTSYQLTYVVFIILKSNPVEQKRLKNNPQKMQLTVAEPITSWGAPESLQALEDLHTTHLFALTSQPITVLSQTAATLSHPRIKESFCGLVEQPVFHFYF